MAKKAGIAKLDLSDRQMHLQFSAAHLKNTPALAELIQSDPRRYSLTPGQILKANLTNELGDSQWGRAKKILKDIIRHVNN